MIFKLNQVFSYFVFPTGFSGRSGVKTVRYQTNITCEVSFNCSQEGEGTVGDGEDATGGEEDAPEGAGGQGQPGGIQRL